MRFVRLWNGDGRDLPAGWESHVPVYWDQLELAEGVYDWRLIDDALAAGDRPCHIGLIIYTSVDMLDHTPAHHRATITLGSGGQTAQMPGYGNAAWREGLWQCLRDIAARYRDKQQVASFWVPLGIDQETQATRAMARDWPAQARLLLDVNDYLTFLTATVREAVAAWAPTPVYLEGAPSPGSVWGRGLRSVIADALDKTGCGYKMNGLIGADRPDALGLGRSTGLGIMDMCEHTVRRAFEPAYNASGHTADELYWMLLWAAHWQADFVALQGSWVLLWREIAAKLPAGERWIVFRDHEYPAVWWGEYGQSGQPGCWGRGLELVGAGGLVFNPATYGEGRWLATAPVAVRAAGLADGLYRCRVGTPSGRAEVAILSVVDERIDLPTGPVHRLDVLGAAAAEPADERLVERVEALEAFVARLREALCA